MCLCRQVTFRSSSCSGPLESDGLIVDHGGRGSNIIFQEPLPFGICPVFDLLIFERLLEVCFVLFPKGREDLVCVRWGWRSREVGERVHCSLAGPVSLFPY